MSFQLEFSFILPRGYLHTSGKVHRSGQMRLATALDEIESVQDPRVQANDAFLPVLLLSRVITRLGDLTAITPDMIASLYVIDLAYLEDLYERMNSPEPIPMNVICPHCNKQFQVQVSPLGADHESDDNI